jgi:hypothetical protein
VTQKPNYKEMTLEALEAIAPEDIEAAFELWDREVIAKQEAQQEAADLAQDIAQNWPECNGTDCFCGHCDVDDRCTPLGWFTEPPTGHD